MLPSSKSIAPYSTPTGSPRARTTPLKGLAHSVGPIPPASMSQRMPPPTYALVSNVNLPNDELGVNARSMKSRIVVNCVIVPCAGTHTPPRTTANGPELKFGLLRVPRSRPATRRRSRRDVQRHWCHRVRRATSRCITRPMPLERNRGGPMP